MCEYRYCPCGAVFTSLGARSKKPPQGHLRHTRWVEKARARPPVSDIENATQASSNRACSVRTALPRRRARGSSRGRKCSTRTRLATRQASVVTAWIRTRVWLWSGVIVSFCKTNTRSAQPKTSRSDRLYSTETSCANFPAVQSIMRVHGHVNSLACAGWSRQACLHFNRVP